MSDGPSGDNWGPPPAPPSTWGAPPAPPLPPPPGPPVWGAPPPPGPVQVQTGYYLPPKSNSNKTVLLVLGIVGGAIVLLGVVAGVVVFAVGNSTINAGSAACRTERAVIITAWNAAATANRAKPNGPRESYIDYVGPVQFKYFLPPTSAGAARINARVAASVCTSISTRELFQPAAPATNDRDRLVRECLTERATIITAWAAAKTANLVDPTGPRETWLDYLAAGYHLQYFETPTAGGTPRREVAVVSGIECIDITATELG